MERNLGIGVRREEMEAAELNFYEMENHQSLINFLLEPIPENPNSSASVTIPRTISTTSFFHEIVHTMNTWSKTKQTQISISPILLDYFIKLVQLNTLESRLIL
ncbi:unnamed protein product [Arabis nemorensis]|uniref:Uncharacterized protein n=1 Tax=Arabis nemorensis TaxID=586526 RepID=A0A565CTF4_9BRAS|nr:unnamed protein product [Arabis nemorensis]